MKLCPIHMLRHTLPHPSAWHDQMYVLHDFHHPLYCINVTPPESHLHAIAVVMGY